jgi:hypothetical protein
VKTINVFICLQIVLFLYLDQTSEVMGLIFALRAVWLCRTRVLSQEAGPFWYQDLIRRSYSTLSR